MNVLFLTSLSTLKACNLPYMQYYFKQFFVLHASEVIFSFLIKMSRQKAIEIEIAFFHSLGNPKGHTLGHFFYASHICHKLPLQIDTYIDELVSEVINETRRVHSQQRIVSHACPRTLKMYPFPRRSGKKSIPFSLTPPKFSTLFLKLSD